MNSSTIYTALQVWILSQVCWTNDNSCGKNDRIFSDITLGKALVQHTYKTIQPVTDDDGCQFYCFLDDDCISYNFDGPQQICNLSDSDHVMHPEHLVDFPDAVYRRAMSSWVLVRKEVCIGAKDDAFAPFTIPTPGKIKRFKLIYLHGEGLTPSTGHNKYPFGYWGSDGLLMIHITDSNNQRISPPKSIIVEHNTLGYRLDGVTSNDKVLILPKIEPPLSVQSGEKFRAWFGQDLTNNHERNNAGKTCVNVMIQ